MKTIVFGSSFSNIFIPLNIITVIPGTPPPQIINNFGTTYSLLFTTVGTTIFTFNVIGKSFNGWIISFSNKIPCIIN